MSRRARESSCIWCALGALAICLLSLGWQSAPDHESKSQAKSQAKSQEKPDAPDRAQVITQAVQHLLAMQEGDDQSEWPYEGVYRVRGEIPIGYRIGGTGICAMALMIAPGFADDHTRIEAVNRATKFILDNAHHPLMNPDYEGGYDVRGWGYTYGLLFLLHLKEAHATPAEFADRAEQTIRFFIDAIDQTEIAKVGGWNYARGQGKDAVSPPATFMTAPTLQALFAAKAAGYAVDEAVVNRGLDALEHGRTPTGSFRYAGVNGEKSREPVPGAVGRMLVSETTLYLAGRSNIANIRSALDAFIVHWDWLEKRRAKNGTHEGPYKIAPYYFYYAHYYAAQAVELLPEQERAEYRRRIDDLIMATRAADGTWNDRVFKRSANYGTAMSMMALLMPEGPKPAMWKQAAGEAAAD